MADYRAIAAVTEAIRATLDRARLALPAADRAVGQFGNLTVTPAADLKDLKPDSLYVYLYRFAVDGTQRARPPRVTADGRRFRPSLPVTLHYLLIPTGTPDLQQTRLAWCVRVLEDQATLLPGALNDNYPGAFGMGETVELVLDPLGLPDAANVWDPFKPQFTVAAAYTARVVNLDSTVELVAGRPVQVREFATAGDAS